MSTTEHGFQLVHGITSWDEGVNHDVTLVNITPGKLILIAWPSTSIHPSIYTLSSALLFHSARGTVIV